jgi:hypothetical protein
VTIRQQGGVFGRNPTFNNVGVQGSLTGLSDLSISGNLIVSNGKGIDFSATAGTGTSELFDDYEEGTWTPTLYGSGGGSATVTVNNATYTKVGNTVHIRAYITVNLSAHTIVGDVRIGGLPYNGVNFSSALASTFCNMFTFDEKTTGVSGYTNGNHFQLMQGSSVSAITATELGTGASTVLILSATYPVP